MRHTLQLVLVLLALTVLPTAAHTVEAPLPVLDPVYAQQLLTDWAGTEPFPEPLVWGAPYFWTPEGTWSDEPTDNFNLFYGHDRDDHIIIIAFPVHLTTGVEDIRQSISLAATFEDIAASLAPPLAPVPEPGTWVLLGTGLLGVAVYIRPKRSRIRRTTSTRPTTELGP